MIRPSGQGTGATYEELIADAVRAPFSGWDFGYLQGRVRDAELPWSYEDLARAEITASSRILDLDTGGGETLAGILHDRTPLRAVATESWEPNIPVARDRLAALGVDVRPMLARDRIPAADHEFTVVLNRHGGCSFAELSRVLAPGGVYLTQGVGRFNDVELNTALGGPPPDYPETATRDHEVRELSKNGFSVVSVEEAFIEFGFLDIGAVVFHLSAVSWQLPGFDAATYDAALRRMDAQIRRDGEFVVRHHRYLIKAVRSAAA